MRIGLVLAAACAAGLVGGLAGTYLKSTAAPAGEARRGPDASDARLADVESALARVEERLRMIELAPPLPAPAAPPPGAAPAESAPPGAEGEEPAPSPGETSPTDEKLDERIAAVIEAREKKADEERRTRMAQMETEREQSTLDRIATELGLAPWQKEQIAAALAKRREAMLGLREKMFAAAGDPTAQAVLREEFRKTQEEMETTLRSFLTKEQVDAVQQNLAPFRPGGPGGRGGGPGSGGGGNR